MVKYKCPYCPKRYQSYNDLIKHCKKIHDIDEVKLNFDGYRKIILGDCIKKE